MRRYLLAAELGGMAGYDSRLPRLATGLVAAGAEVCLAARDVAVAASELAEVVEVLAAPTKVRTTHTGEIHCVADLLEQVGFGERDELTAMTLAWRELLQAWQADVVVVEHSPSALLAARTLALPIVVLGEGYDCPPAVTLAPLFAVIPPSDEKRQRAALAEQRVVALANQILLSCAARPIESIAQLFHETDATLCCSYPELLPYEAQQAQFTRVMGHGGVVDHDESDSPRRDQRSIVVRLQMFPGIEIVLKWLQRQGAKVWLIDETHEVQHRWRELTRSFEIAHTQRFGEVVKRCDLVVMSAGHQAVATCLCAGKPMVLLPRSFDQLLLAERVMQIGAGLSPPWHQPELIAADLDHVWREAYFRDQAKQFANRHRELSRESLEGILQLLLKLPPQRRWASNRT